MGNAPALPPGVPANARYVPGQGWFWDVGNQSLFEPEPPPVAGGAPSLGSKKADEPMPWEEGGQGGNALPPPGGGGEWGTPSGGGGPGGGSPGLPGGEIGQLLFAAAISVGTSVAANRIIGWLEKKGGGVNTPSNGAGGSGAGGGGAGGGGAGGLAQVQQPPGKAIVPATPSSYGARLAARVQHHMARQALGIVLAADPKYGPVFAAHPGWMAGLLGMQRRARYRGNRRYQRPYRSYGYRPRWRYPRYRSRWAMSPYDRGGPGP